MAGALPSPEGRAEALVRSLASGELADAPRNLLAAYPGELLPPKDSNGRDWTSRPEPWGDGWVSVTVRKAETGEPALVDMKLDLKHCVDVRRIGDEAGLHFANDLGISGFRFGKWNESQRLTIMGAPGTGCLERIVALDRSFKR